MEKNYFIIHGSYGNPYKNWIPSLKSQLSKRKLNCIVPSFTTPYKQDYESWSTILMSYFKIGYITENTTLITHSLGGIFIAKFLIEHGIKIKKLITVAAFNNIQFDKDNDLYNSFYIKDKELKQICELCNEVICFYSNNDPYVPIEKAEMFADIVKGKKIIINNAGHFNEKSGYKEFREIMEYIN